MKPFIKKYLQIHGVTTLTIYTSVYIFASFVKWKLYNPFQWIIDLPTYDALDRALILSCLIIYEIILLITTSMKIEESKS